jgi:hydroxymethylbilane synthase
MHKIRAANPDLEVRLKKISTTGDRDSHTQLDRMGVGIFVKELEQALLDGRIDLAVHSLKDLPTEVPQGLALIAVTERLDPRDALVAKAKLKEITPGSKIGTGSLRRAVQLNNYRPDLEVRSIRGNVDTRLRKVDAGDIDGVIIAVAAVMRLGWEAKITEYLSPEHFLPAVGQGALVLEARQDDDVTAKLVSPMNHLPTWQSVMAERVFLHNLGGGCRSPIAALGAVNSSRLKLTGMVASPDGQRMLYTSEEGSAASPEELGARLAGKMLDMGASELIIGGSGR